MTHRFPLDRLAAAALLALSAAPALATNGMNLEGYGPISAGMGGASQAFDHGTAATIQNPATLSLMQTDMRLDLAVGVLGPRIESRAMGMSSASGGRSYTMPALGYARRSGDWTYGLGLFAQGGMGTEYGADSFLAAGSGQPVRSELAFGRLILPLSLRVTPQLAVGGSLDYVWGSLDLRMAASGAQLGALVTGAGGNLGAALPSLGGAPWARIDFSDDSKFTGSAKGSGWASKLGLVYQASDALTLGLSYQFKTSLSDMETGARDATLSATGGFADSGRITVQDFQWPAMAAAGLAWQATPALLVAADVKHIAWSDVMNRFRMRYDSAGLGGSVSFALPQEWKDQTVLNLGVAWAATPDLTLRAGLNVAGNPVPDTWLNPLFPATVERHLTGGVSFKLAPGHALHASLTIAPTTTATGGNGVEVSHRQQNLQLMYSYSR